ncbi:unnamed protein product [Caenorhabditis brenneri]
MRISRYIFIVIICLLSIKFAISKDYGGKTTSRLDGREKRDSDEQSLVEVMTDRHTKLATLFNYLYLQQTFSENKTNEVIAKMWSMPDESVIEKLLSLDFDKIKKSLEQLKSVPDTFPSQWTTTSMSEAKEALNKIQDITSDEKLALKAFGGLQKLPLFVSDSHVDNWRISFKEAATQVLKGLEYIAGAEDITKTYLYLLNGEGIAHYTENYEFCLRMILTVRREFFEDSKGISMTNNMIKIAETLNSKLADFDKLSKALNNSLSLLRNFRNLTESLDVNTVELMTNVLDPPQKTPFSIFVKKHELEITDKEDLYTESLIGGEVGSLTNEHFESFRTKFNVTNRARSAFSKGADSVGSLEFSRILLNSRIEQKNVNFTILFGCLDILQGESSTLFTNISELRFEVFLEGMKKYDGIFKEEATKIAEYQKKAKEYRFRTSFVKNFTTGAEYDRWRNSTEFQDMKSFAGKLLEFADFLKSTDEFKESAEEIKGSHDKWEMFQKWVRNVKMLKYECDPLFDFDLRNIEWINSVPTAADFVKDPLLLETTFITVNSLSKSLNKLFSLSQPRNNGTHFKATNKENLLALTQAITDLRTISDIDKTIDEKMIGKVIEGGDEVVKAIGTLTVNKKKLEKIWRHWPTTKDKLKEFRKSVSKIMDQIRNEPEDTLENVGLMYRWISVVRLEGIPEFDKYRESLRLLDRNPAPELEEALQKLEVPMSMDWDLVHMNFRRMPEVMRELQKDFDCFFDENKCPKKPEDRSMIMMEQYRKNQENFYKIDLRKQLLSLAYGWSMAIVPPGLLLLTWLWIIGKFNKHYYGKEDDYETESDTDSDSDWDDGYTSTDSNESNTAYYRS